MRIKMRVVFTLKDTVLNLLSKRMIYFICVVCVLKFFRKKDSKSQNVC